MSFVLMNERNWTKTDGKLPAVTQSQKNQELIEIHYRPRPEEALDIKENYSVILTIIFNTVII